MVSSNKSETGPKLDHWLLASERASSSCTTGHLTFLFSTNLTSMNICPTLTHLGDLVNIVQQYHNKADYIYTKHVKAQVILDFLLPLFDGTLKRSAKPFKAFEYVTTTWFAPWPNEFGTMCWCPLSYKKAINLPETHGSHVVYQFDARSPVPWTKTIPATDIKAIGHIVGPAYNIGDNDIPGSINCTQYSLQDKFKLLSTAKLYIGIGSGLSHLALMTNTPTYITYEGNNNPWFFFPDDATIIESKALISTLKESFS